MAMEPRIEEVASEVTSLRQYVVSLENGVGPVSVFVEGELERMRDSNNVWLTLHDVGNSYQQFVAFNQQEDMNEARQRSLFLHVSLPGQHSGAEDLTAFPDLDTLGLTLVNVLDFLRIKTVLVLGVGAGANIALRFAAKHPTKLHGLVLISPSAGESAGKAHWDIVKTNVFRKTSKVTREDLNANNVAKYAAANKDRTDMLPVLSAGVTCKVLVISKAIKVEAGEAIMREIRNGNCEFIKLDGDEDPMVVATRRVAEAVVHFAQGLGLVPNATKRKTSRCMSTTGSDSASLVSTESQGEVVSMVGKKQGRKNSMQEADMPNIRRLSLVSSHQI